MPGTLRNLKFLIFFVDCSIIDARLVFVYTKVLSGVLCVEKGVCTCSLTNFSSKVSGTLLHFYFDQQTGGNPKLFKNLKLFEFFLLITVLLMLSYFL